MLKVTSHYTIYLNLGSERKL